MTWDHFKGWEHDMALPASMDEPKTQTEHDCDRLQAQLDRIKDDQNRTYEEQQMIYKRERLRMEIKRLGEEPCA